MSAQWTWMTDLVGWTLLHFVWQGTLAALGLGFALSCVPIVPKAHFKSSNCTKRLASGKKFLLPIKCASVGFLPCKNKITASIVFI